MTEATINLTDPLLLQKMMQLDSWEWAINSNIRLLGNTLFTNEGCEYLKEIMRDSSEEKAIQKGAQARITTVFMMDAIHGLINNSYPQGVIYYFPTEKAVESFSKTRFGPLVDDNPCIKEHLQDTNSVSIKKVGSTFLRLFGASATKLIQNKKDGTSVRSEPADYVIRDERDLFDDSMVRMSKDRLQNSKIGKEVDLGTPTIPDFGISKCFNESDQRHWMIPCRACNDYTCLVEEFPNCVKWKDGEPFFGCIKCGQPINPREGHWVAKHPERRVAGWLVSHLITPNVKLQKLMDRWEKDQRDGNIGEFYNGVLGLPYIPAEDRLRHSDVYACCGNDVMRTDISISQTALGADIGKHYHTVVVAEKVDKRRAKIIYMARAKGFQAIHGIRRKYNCKSAVIDRRPYEEEFENFQKQAMNDSKNKCRVYGAEYKDRQRAGMKTDEQTSTYSLLRNQIFDRSHAWIINKEVELPRRCSEVEEFVRQMCNCAKVLEETDAGDRLYRYIKLGDDHYRSAVNYLMIALDDLTYTQGMGTPGYSVNETGTDWNPLEIN